LSFIKSQLSHTIIPQLDTLCAIKRRYKIHERDYGKDPAGTVEKSIQTAIIIADQILFDVLERKKHGDAKRNALNVINRLKFLFYLPVNIEANIANRDYNQLMENFEHAKSLYGGEGKHEIFKKYLDAAETHITILKEKLYKKLETVTSLYQQKRVLFDLLKLDHIHDPAWKCVKINYSRLLKVMDIKSMPS